MFTSEVWVPPRVSHAPVSALHTLSMPRSQSSSLEHDHPSTQPRGFVLQNLFSWTLSHWQLLVRNKNSLPTIPPTAPAPWVKYKCLLSIYYHFIWHWEPSAEQVCFFFRKYIASFQYFWTLVDYSCCLHVICQLTWKRFSQLFVSFCSFLSPLLFRPGQKLSNSLECKCKLDKILFYGKLSGHTSLMSNFVAKFLYDGGVNEHSALAAIWW